MKTKSKIKKHTTPEFLDKAAGLIEDLRQFSPADLALLMNVSDDIANLTFERYSRWKTPFDTENSRPALLAFRGEVYRGMDADSFSKEDTQYAQDHLRILSGLYGMLRPLDLIQPYRLEMGAKFTTSRGTNLYGFWKDTITAALNRDLQNHGEKVVVNLSSKEYFKAVDAKKLEGDIVTPVFKEYGGDKYRVIVTLTKKARGLMSRFIIRNRVEKAEDIKMFDLGGYRYDENLSTRKEWVFTR